MIYLKIILKSKVMVDEGNSMINQSSKFSIGIDVEETERFKGLLLRKDGIFLNRIYTKKELKYCFSKANPELHLAGRFVAKEAVFKALAAVGLSPISLKKIEILANINNVPQVVVCGLKKDYLDIGLSISHSQNSAIAFALVVKYEKSHKKSHSK